jgi:prepilin peptidase CpaA
LEKAFSDPSSRLAINHYLAALAYVSMDVVLNLALFALISLAAYFDIKERRIPNWLILFGFIGGVLLAALQGSTHLVVSVASFFVGIVALLIPFAFGWMGAGDVKLLAAISALLGYSRLPRVLFYSSLVAGSIALLALASGYARQLSFRNFWTDCKFMFLTVPTGLPKSIPLESNASAYSVPWGAAIAAGTIMAYYIDSTGTWAGF